MVLRMSRRRRIRRRDVRVSDATRGAAKRQPYLPFLLPICYLGSDPNNDLNFLNTCPY